MNPIQMLANALRSVYTAFKHMLIPRMTLRYPEQNQVLPPDYRGQHYLEMEKCTGCRICEMSCPPRAIVMVQREPHPRNKRGIYPLINYNYCIYCGYCVIHCPFGAIHELDIHDLAVYDRDDLIHPPEFLQMVKYNPQIVYEPIKHIKDKRWKMTPVDVEIDEKGARHKEVSNKS